MNGAPESPEQQAQKNMTYFAAKRAGLEEGRREETTLNYEKKRENSIYCSKVDVRSVCRGGRDTDRVRRKRS